jgi:hypothetical protein
MVEGENEEQIKKELEYHNERDKKLELLESKFEEMRKIADELGYDIKVEFIKK